MTDMTTGETTATTMNSVGDDLLSTLVGDDKKYKTLVDLAKSKVEGDSFINKLKEENSALRSLISNQDETKRSTKLMQELLDKVSKGTLVGDEGTNTKHSEPSSNQSDKALTTGDVAEIYKVMKTREQQDKNLDTAMKHVKGKYKDKTEEVLKSKANEIGLDYDSLLETARRSPIAFLNLIGENNVTNNTQAYGIKSSVNSTAVIDTNGVSGKPNKAYYDKLKQEMGVKKFILDRVIQVQMHKDMTALGDEFDS